MMKKERHLEEQNMQYPTSIWIWGWTAVALVLLIKSVVDYFYDHSFVLELFIGLGLFVVVLYVNYLVFNLEKRQREINRLARKNEEMQHSADQLTMLNDISRAITTLGDLDSVLNIIREQIQRIIPVDAFIVLLYHPETNTLYFPLVYDNGRNWPEPERELIPEMKSYDIIKNTGRSLLVNLTLQEFEERTKLRDRSLIGDHNSQYRSFLYAPLMRQSRVIGVVSAINYEFNMYTNEHLKLLERVAVQATIAIENARLFQAQQKEIVERKQAEAEVRTLNLDLEQRVERRTLQLQEVNENLNREKERLEGYTRQREIMSAMIDLLQASLTTKEASEVILNHLQLLFPQRDGALYLTNSAATLEPILMWGIQEGLNITFGTEECWGIRRGKPYLFGSESPNPPCPHVERNNSNHALCVPLSAQGENIGSLYVATRANDLLDEEEQKLVVIVADSIALALANLRLREKLHFQSTRDSLTGLFNRRYLDETLPLELSRAARNSSSLSVIMFDVDDFKKFNDIHGHDAGDLVLKEMARLILSNIREADIACRYGGDEFIIVLPNTEVETAVQRAVSLCNDAAHLELQLNNVFLGKVTISVGLAAFPQHGNKRDGLIKSADEALYQAKEKGRNCVMVKD